MAKQKKMKETIIQTPNSSLLQDLAQEYGADRDRFEKEASFCILCGLCVRYCAEVKKKNAIGYAECGARREIRFIPEIAATECVNCKECFELCPTSYLQAAFVLIQALALLQIFISRVNETSAFAIKNGIAHFKLIFVVG